MVTDHLSQRYTKPPPASIVGAEGLNIFQYENPYITGNSFPKEKVKTKRQLQNNIFQELENLEVLFDMSSLARLEIIYSIAPLIDMSIAEDVSRNAMSDNTYDFKM